MHLANHRLNNVQKKHNINFRPITYKAFKEEKFFKTKKDKRKLIRPLMPFCFVIYCDNLIYTAL